MTVVGRWAPRRSRSDGHLVDLREDSVVIDGGTSDGVLPEFRVPDGSIWYVSKLP